MSIKTFITPDAESCGWKMKPKLFRPRGYLRHPIRTLQALYIAHMIDCQLQGIHPCGSAEYHDWHEPPHNFTVSGDIPFSARLLFSMGRRDYFRRKFEAAQCK
jgi:hypothetical protein